MFICDGALIIEKVQIIKISVTFWMIDIWELFLKPVTEGVNILVILSLWITLPLVAILNCKIDW